MFTELKKELPDIKSGDTVRVHQKIKEKGKERLQAFEGVVLARKHGKGVSATITVRKVISGIGVEKIFPIHSPLIEKIEILKRGKTKRAKLYYLRKARGKKSRIRRKDFAGAIAWEEEKPEEDSKKEVKKEEPKKEEIKEEKVEEKK